MISKLRFGAVVVASAATAVLSASCSAIVGEPERETVLIGVDLELSGAGIATGEAFLQAMELRVEQINEQGLIDDRELELKVLDNRSDRATSVTNLQSLAGDPSVLAIISGGCAGCVVDAVEAIDQAGVPTISLAQASDVVEPVAERRHIFKVGLNAQDNAGLLASTLSRAGIDTIGLVTTDDAYGEEGQREMSTSADRSGIEVAAVESITSDSDRIAGAAAQLAAYQPEQDPAAGFEQDAQADSGLDGVVVWAPPAQAAEFAVALRAEGYDGPLFLDAAAADDVVLAGSAGEALAGATMVFTETLVIDDVIATSPAKVARKTWVRDYSARYGRYHAAAAFAADAVEIIVQAINAFEDADSDRSVLRTAIEVTQLEGFSGTIQMSPRQHSGLRPQALTTLVARGDRWRPSV